jgi:hypothetical protein
MSQCPRSAYKIMLIADFTIVVVYRSTVGPNDP